ncbi:MAG: DedA family protein [Minisyncoccota bacterium]
MKKYIPTILPIIFFLSFSIIFYIVTPEGIISFIGVENAYLLMFILALIGGLSTFSGVPYHVVLVALAVGGVNIFLLGAITAIGVMVGDSTSYYIGYKGGGLLPEKAQIFLGRLRDIKNKYPKLLPVIFLFYGSFLPFSNDVVVIPMGILKYPFWRVMVPLGIGNIIFNIGLGLIAVYAYDFLKVFPFFS